MSQAFAGCGVWTNSPKHKTRQGGSSGEEPNLPNCYYSNMTAFCPSVICDGIFLTEVDTKQAVRWRAMLMGIVLRG